MFGIQTEKIMGYILCTRQSIVDKQWFNYLLINFFLFSNIYFKEQFSRMNSHRIFLNFYYSPKSPPNSPNNELSTDDDLKGVYINHTSHKVCYNKNYIINFLHYLLLIFSRNFVHVYLLTFVFFQSLNVFVQN